MAGVPPDTSETMTEKRKLQVCNGYLLEFEQMARLLSCLAEKTTARRIRRDALAGETGLADRQIESLISIGSAMGLIQPMTQVLTPVGRLICHHDVFMEAQGTLEWCHYKAAGNPRNLVWFEAGTCQENAT